MTIPIAFLMGFYMRVLRPGRVLETTAIGVSLLLLAIVAGGWVQESGGGLADFFTLEPETLVDLPDASTASSRRCCPCGCCSRRATTCRRS